MTYGTGDLGCTPCRRHRCLDREPRCPDKRADLVLVVLVAAECHVAGLAAEYLASRSCVAMFERSREPKRCAAATGFELKAVSAGPPCPACAGRAQPHSCTATVPEQARHWDNCRNTRRCMSEACWAVRINRRAEAGRLGPVGENVQRTADRALVACRWGSP